MLTNQEHDAIATAWKQLDLGTLESIRVHLMSTHLEDSKVVGGMIEHLKGNFTASSAVYDSVNFDQISDRLLREIFKTENIYIAMKVQRTTKRRSPLRAGLDFLKLFLLGNSNLAATVRHHYLYAWCITTFWYDQRQSLISGVLLFAYGLVSRNAEARTHGMFLTGHICNVMGYARPGIKLVVKALDSRDQINPWLRTCFFSYMAYGLFMVGREEDRVPLILQNSEEALKRQPDPFYRILHLVSVLRAASQAGDVLKAEAIAPLLIEISERSGSKRFLYSSKADLALCYGIRGMLWKCDELLLELEKFESDQGDPVETGSLLRLRGWVHFFVGNYEAAYRDAELSLRAFRATKSFYMALEMARILKLVAGFRIAMSKNPNLTAILVDLSGYVQELGKLDKRYAKNRILKQMVQEERSLVLDTFQRFSQPGYSRSSSVVNCQLALHSRLSEVIHAVDDQDAWGIISEVLESSLGCRLKNLSHKQGQPGFEARRSQAYEQVVEVLVPRENLRENSVENQPGFDVAFFACDDKYQVPILLDALYSLQPMIALLFKTRDLQGRIVANARVLAKAELAGQVAHDIRSPLTALNMVVSTLKPEDDDKKFLIRNAMQRISDIANSLLNRSNASDPQPADPAKESDTLIMTLIEMIVSEKRIHSRERGNHLIDTDFGSLYGVFAKINAIELGRVLSNLLNNALESLSDPGGQVSIAALKNEKNKILIVIKDNGRGMPPEVVSRLGERGFSHGKGEHGSGLGFHHAKKTVEDAGGTVAITSRLNEGTTIQIELPEAKAPQWFLERLVVEKNATIVTVDDEQTIHQLWAERFALAFGEQNYTHLCFNSLRAFEEWKNQSSIPKFIALIDFQFPGTSESGLDAIIRLNLTDVATLVTSRYDQKSIKRIAAQRGIRMLPKGLMGAVPMEMSHTVQSRQNSPTVVVDGEDRVRKSRVARSSLDKMPPFERDVGL